MPPLLYRQPSLTQRPQEDQEPFVLGDPYGIVVVWPDRYVRHFSWDVLRHVAVIEDESDTSWSHAETQEESL